MGCEGGVPWGVRAVARVPSSWSRRRIIGRASPLPSTWLVTCSRGVVRVRREGGVPWGVMRSDDVACHLQQRDGEGEA
jgi:hypothetical protein